MQFPFSHSFRQPHGLGRIALILLAACGLNSAAGAELVSFSREIRPLLGRNCVACHGGVKMAGDISLIYRSSVTGEGESGMRTVVPGKPAESELIRRITSSNPELQMPPPDHGPPLAADEIALLERWIAEGAAWEDHWAFVPPTRISLPEFPDSEADSAWPSVPLDHFVLTKLKANGLNPSPPAPASEWLRRVSLDLTGLPPTLAELSAFEASGNTPAARSEVVDRLLDSPHFGERWAAMWLDLARYSDTYGFEKDPHRDIWPYRDWLIRAFNADMPYDEFIVTQLAGDLLPHPTADQRLATAFQRNTQTNTEGGTNDEEYRIAAVIDRVNTTWTAFQATTFGCVQCHSHPYDPITHEEYFRFLDFYNQTEDTDLDDDFPRMGIAHDDSLRDQRSDLELKATALAAQENQLGLELAATAAATAPAARWHPSKLENRQGEVTLRNDGVIVASGTLPAGVITTLSGNAPDFQAIRIQILRDSDDPASPPERGSYVTGFQVNVIAADGTRRGIPLADIVSDHLGGPYEPRPTSFGAYPKLAEERNFIIVCGEPVVFAEGETLELEFTQGARTTGDQATPLRKFSVALDAAPQWAEWIVDPQRNRLTGELAATRNAISAIPALPVPVMIELPAAGRRETRVFARGNRMDLMEPVTPGIPAVFGITQPVRNRLEMAHWLVSPEQPLTARVMANRLWAELFGIGIVETLEDFGSSGAEPSNQPLLDHLALRFRVDFKWSVQELLREIVLSSTYLQSQRATAELVERDPHNRLLARGPRNRLTAEMVRDNALASGDLISRKMFGPPVFPAQPEGVWNSVYNNQKWESSSGEDALRRSIYTYRKRTSGYPSQLIFDAPAGDLCSARRIPSNTPLQALVTLNDPVFITAAQGLAAAMETSGADLRGRLTEGVLRVSQRQPSPAMLDELESLYHEAATEFAANPEDATALTGGTGVDAALILVANTLLNLDSALNR